MKTPMEVGAHGVSRRAVLTGGAALSVGAVMVATQAVASPKVSKDCVHFVQVATGDHRCGNCRLFRGPSECLDVAGEVTGDCSCRIWLPRVS
jgi:hypothetical protein